MLKKLAKALVTKVMTKGIVGVDVEDISEAPRAEVLAVENCRSHQIYIVDVDVGDIGEAPIAVGVKG